MTAHRWLLLAATVGVLAGCGGIRVGGVGSVDTSRFVVGELEAPMTYRLVADADATVHSAADWRSEPLGEEGWLVAGSSAARGEVWFAYFRFDLTAIPAGTSVSSARLGIPLAELGEVDTGLAVHLVAEDWDEERVVWTRQPRVARHSIAAVVHDPDAWYPEPAVGGDRVELTRVVHEAVARGDASLSLLVVPSDPTASFRRRWLSVESNEGDLTSMSPAPTLHVVAGPAPPPPNAAERDVLRGGRTILRD